MAEPELIQRQRELLRAFREATAQRIKAEAEAEPRFQKAIEKAKESHDDDLRKAAQDYATLEAKVELATLRLAVAGFDSPVKGADASIHIDPSDNPLDGLNKCITEIDEIVARIEIFL